MLVFILTASGLALGVKSGVGGGNLNNGAVEAVFTEEVPVPYQVVAADALDSGQKAQGFYTLLKNPETATQILILDIRQTLKDSPYLDDNLAVASKTLLCKYPLLSGPAPLNVKAEPVQAASPDHRLANLEIWSANNQLKPGFIGWLKYPANRVVILLLTAPALADKATILERDAGLRAEANRLLPAIRPSDKLLPSERYMLWRIRHIFN